MPHILVKLVPGKSEQQKTQLAEAITRDVMSILGSVEDNISVALEEISPADWTEHVYKPDIQQRWETLYKKPGYQPSSSREQTMTQWPKDDIQKIAATDDLHISPLREDNKTYGTPTWIWPVVADGSLYVRPYNGTKSRWYQAAIQQKHGRITAAGITREVTFHPISADDAVNQSIDDAYRSKYHSSPYLKPMITGAPRSATIKITPR